MPNATDLVSTVASSFILLIGPLPNLFFSMTNKKSFRVRSGFSFSTAYVTLELINWAVFFSLQI